MQTRVSQLLEAVSQLWGPRSAKGAELQLGIVFKLLNAPGLTQRLAAIDVLRDMALRLARESIGDETRRGAAAAGTDSPAEDAADGDTGDTGDTGDDEQDTSFGLHSLAGWLSSHKVQFIAGLTGRNMHSKCLERARGLITVLAKHGEVDDPSLDQLWTVVSKAHDAADEARPIYDMVASIVESAPVGQALSLLDRVWAGADEEYTKSAALVARLAECKRSEETDDHLVQSSLISLAWRVLFHPAAPVSASNAGPLHPRTRRRRSADETSRVLKYLKKAGHLMLMAALRLSQTRLCISLPKNIVLRLQSPAESAKATACIHADQDALSSIMLTCLAVIRQETRRFQDCASSGGSQRPVRDVSVRALDLLAQGLRFAHFLCEKPSEDIFQLSLFERLLVVSTGSNGGDCGDTAADGPPATAVPSEATATCTGSGSELLAGGHPVADAAPCAPPPRATPPDDAKGDRVSLLLAYTDALHGMKDTVLQNLHAFALHRSSPPLPSLRVRCAFLYSMVRHAPSLLLSTDEIVDLWAGALSRSLNGRHAAHELTRRLCGGGVLDIVVQIQESYGTSQDSARAAWQDCKHETAAPSDAALVPGDLFEPIQKRDAHTNDDEGGELEDPSDQLLWTGLHYESSLEHAGAFRSLVSSLQANLMDVRPTKPQRYGSLESTSCLNDRETYRAVQPGAIPHSVFTQRDVLLLEGQMLQLFLFFFDVSSPDFKPALLTSESLALFQIMFVKLNSSNYAVRCGKRVPFGSSQQGQAAEAEGLPAVERLERRSQLKLHKRGGGVLLKLQLEGSSPRLLSSHTFPALGSTASEYRLEEHWADVAAPSAARLIGVDSLLAMATQAPPPIAAAAGELLVGLHVTMARQATELVAYAYVDALEQLDAAGDTVSPVDSSRDLWRRISGMAISHPLVDSLLQALQKSERDNDPAQSYTALRSMQLISQYVAEIDELSRGVTHGGAWTQHAVPEVVVDPTEAPTGADGAISSPGRSTITSPATSPGRRSSGRFTSSGSSAGPMQFRWRPCSLMPLVEANTDAKDGRVTMRAVLMSSCRVMQVLTGCVDLPSHLEQVSGGKAGLPAAPTDGDVPVPGRRPSTESADESAFLVAVHSHSSAVSRHSSSGAEPIDLPELAAWRTLWNQGARHTVQAVFTTTAQGSPADQSSSSSALALRHKWNAFTPEPLRLKSTWVPRVYIASAGYSAIFGALRAFSGLGARTTPAPMQALSSPHAVASPPRLTRESSAQSAVLDDEKSDKRARVAAVAARDHAWQLLMQLPTSLQGSEALADPAVVDWPALLADGGWNTLYTLQGVVAKLKDANSRKAGDGSDDAAKALEWRAAFLAAGGLRSVLKRLVDFAGGVSGGAVPALPPPPQGSATGGVLPPPLPPGRQASAAQGTITETKVQAQVSTLCLRVLRICSKFVSSDDLSVLQTAENLGEHPAVVFGCTLVNLLGDITGHVPSARSVAGVRERGDTSDSLGLGGDTPVVGAADTAGSSAGTLPTAASTAVSVAGAGGAAKSAAGTGGAEGQEEKKDSQLREALDILLLLMSIGSRFGEFGGSKSSSLLGAVLEKPGPAGVLSCVMLRSDLRKVRHSLQRSVFLSADVLAYAPARKQGVAALLAALAASDTLGATHFEGVQVLCQMALVSAYGPTASISLVGPVMHCLLSLVAYFKTRPTSGVRWPLVAALHACGHLLREVSAATSSELDRLVLGGGCQLVQPSAGAEPEGTARIHRGSALLEQLLTESPLPQASAVDTLLAFTLDVTLFTQAEAAPEPASSTSNWPLCVAPEERAAAYSLLRFVLLAAAQPALAGAFDDPHLFPSRGAAAASAAQWFDGALRALAERTAGSGTPLDSDWAHELSLDVRGPNSYMGLVNPKGATCYANSVVQQLFMDRSFQNTVLEAQEASVPMLRSTLGLAGADGSAPSGAAADAPADGGANEPEAGADGAADEAAGSKRREWLQHRRLLVELQKTFKWLRASEHKSYNPSKLLETLNCLKLSFNVHEQNDAPEFFVKLIDHLERVTAGTPQGDALKRRFVGRVAQQITPFAAGAELRERPDKFTVLGVSVKKHSTLESALRAEFAPEMLYGANGVELPSGDRCDAEKRDVITRLPEVLVVQLRRFETTYTATGVDITKVNSRLAFPQILDMKPYTKWGVAEDRAAAELEAAVCEETPDAEAIAAAKRALREAQQLSPPAGSENYKLAGVVVHTGTARGGHYYSFSKDEETGAWWELNDTFTSTFSERSLHREAFGGHEYVRMGLYEVVARPLKRNAVMLFYHRCDEGPLTAPGDAAAAAGEGEESAPHLDDVDVQDEAQCPSSMAMVPTQEAHAALDAELTSMNQQAAEQIQRYDAQLMTFFGMLCKDLTALARRAVDDGPFPGSSSAGFELGDVVPAVASPFKHSVLSVCGAHATQLFLDIGMRCIDASARTLYSLLALSPVGHTSSVARLLSRDEAGTVQDVRMLLKTAPFRWLDAAADGDGDISPLKRTLPMSTLMSGLLDVCGASAPAADLVVRCLLQSPAAAGKNSRSILDLPLGSSADVPMTDLEVERFLSPSLTEAAADSPVPFKLPWWAMQRCTPEGIPLLPKADAVQLDCTQMYLAHSPVWLQEGLLTCSVETARARLARLAAAALAGSASCGAPPTKARVAAYKLSTEAPVDPGVYPSPFLPAAVRQLPPGCWWAPRTAFERDSARRQQLARFASLDARLKVQLAQYREDLLLAERRADSARQSFQPVHARLAQLREELHEAEAPLEDSELDSDATVMALRATIDEVKAGSADLRAAALKAVQAMGAANSVMGALKSWMASVQALQHSWLFSVRHPESPATLALLQWFSSALSACDPKSKADAHEFFSLVPLLAEREEPLHAAALPDEADSAWAVLRAALLTQAHSQISQVAHPVQQLSAADLASNLRSLYTSQRQALWRQDGEPRWLAGRLFPSSAPNGLCKLLATMNVSGSLARLVPAMQDAALVSSGSYKTNTLRAMLQATAALTPLQPWSHPSAQHLFSATATARGSVQHPLYSLLSALGTEGAFAAQVASRAIAQSSVWQTLLQSAGMDADHVLGYRCEVGSALPAAEGQPALAIQQLRAVVRCVHDSDEGMLWAPILAEIVAGLPPHMQRGALRAVIRPTIKGGTGLLYFHAAPAVTTGRVPAGAHTSEAICRFLYELCTPRVLAGPGPFDCHTLQAELTVLLMRAACRSVTAAQVPPGCDLQDADIACGVQNSFMWDVAHELRQQQLLVSPWAQLPLPDHPVLSLAQWMPQSLGSADTSGTGAAAAALAAEAWDWGPVADTAVKMLSYSLIFKAEDVHEDSKTNKLSTAMYVAMPDAGRGEYGQAAFYLRRTLYMRAQIMQELQFLRRLLIPRSIQAASSAAGASAAPTAAQAEEALHCLLRPSTVRRASMPSPLSVREEGDTLAVRVSGAGCALVNGVYVNYKRARQFGAPVFKRRFAGQWITLARFRANNATEPWYILRAKSDGCSLRADIDYYVSQLASTVPPPAAAEWQPLGGGPEARGKAPCPSITQVCGPPMTERAIERAAAGRAGTPVVGDHNDEVAETLTNVPFSSLLDGSALQEATGLFPAPADEAVDADSDVDLLGSVPSEAAAALKEMVEQVASVSGKTKEEAQAALKANNFQVEAAIIQLVMDDDEEDV